MMPLPQRSTLFPYTTLFRSQVPWIKTGARVRGSDREYNFGRLRVREADKSIRVGPTPIPAQMLRSSTLARSEEHTFELQSPYDIVCRLLLEKKNHKNCCSRS